MRERSPSVTTMNYWFRAAGVPPTAARRGPRQWAGSGLDLPTHAWWCFRSVRPAEIALSIFVERGELRRCKPRRSGVRHHEVLPRQPGSDPSPGSSLTTVRLWRRLDHLQRCSSACRGAWADDVFSAQCRLGRQVVWVILARVHTQPRAPSTTAACDYCAGPLRRHAAPAACSASRRHTALGARRWLRWQVFHSSLPSCPKLLLVVVLAAYLSRSDRVSCAKPSGGALAGWPRRCACLTQPDSVPRS